MIDDIAIVERVDALASSDDADEAILLLQRIDVAKKRIRELDQMVREAVIEFIDRTGIEPEIDDEKRYYVGAQKRIKCRSVGATLETVLERTYGDIETIVELLSSNAFKHGACRDVLGDDWERHFSTETVKDLKTGKPKRTLALANDKFSRK